MVQPTSRFGIKASAAILVDADSGQVLYEKNADVLRPPASTTKIMTAILLLEHCKPDDILIADKSVSNTGGSSLNLKIGEQVTARDMLYGLMLRSANDGCVAVANHIAGSEQKFAELMTAKAHEIGAVNTTFRNCNGLNCPGHLTTARDLATMARYAIHFPEFNEATRTKYHAIKRDSKNKDVLLKNHAKFLWKFPFADGIKTGWTVPAGHCFVGSATGNGWRLISVVLNSPDIVGETVDLMKYGFSHFKREKIISAGSPAPVVKVTNGISTSVTSHYASDVFAITERSTAIKVEAHPLLKTVSAPILHGAKLGTLRLISDGRLTGKTDVLADNDVPVAPISTSILGLKWIGFGSGALCLIVISYGSSIAKAARGRRYRLKAKLRNNDQRWKSSSKR